MTKFGVVCVCCAGASSLCSSPDVAAMPPGQPLGKVAASTLPPGHRKAPKIGLIRSVQYLDGFQGRVVVLSTPSVVLTHCVRGTA